MSFEDPEKKDSLDHGDDISRPDTGRRKSSMSRRKNSAYEDPFSRKEDVDEGEMQDAEIDYQSMEWWQASMIMIAETISLGILSLPSVLARIGLVPGLILIVGLGIIATYTGWVIGQFRMKYPWVVSFADAGEILFKPLKMGAIGREFFGGAQTIFLIFTMASHILTWTICLNTVTDSATCTVVWAVIGLVVFFIFDLPRTLKNVSWMSIASFISIFSAVLISMIAIGIQKPRGNTPLAVTTVLPFTDAFVSVSNIVFAYAGHSCFFGFLAEMKNPSKDWTKALVFLQIWDISLYIVAATVIYVFAGPDVTSPALGSAGPIVKKVAWGIAIPTIIIAGIIYGHVAAKYIFVRCFRGTKHMNRRTKTSTIAWTVITLTIWVIAWIIAESIPNFNDLLGLISALFASHFTYTLSGVFGLFLNHGHWFDSPKQISLFCINWIVIAIGATVCVAGLYSSGTAIAADGGNGSWTCASNAQ
ncbi:amino acid transporter [Aureobasidium pullulans]|uniref:Amino acid transporter n=1 Tax=Aureobasidium pullulans TaxID=5580 RepID=A0AB74K389_AURPU|nr:amino acid transporter [Aureobasidium pullulans]